VSHVQGCFFVIQTVLFTSLVKHMRFYFFKHSLSSANCYTEAYVTSGFGASGCNILVSKLRSVLLWRKRWIDWHGKGEETCQTIFQETAITKFCIFLRGTWSKSIQKKECDIKEGAKILKQRKIRKRFVKLLRILQHMSHGILNKERFMSNYFGCFLYMCN